MGVREDNERGKLYKGRWSDDSETEEPLSSLVNVPEMVTEFEARRGKAAPRARVARSRLGEKAQYTGTGEQEEAGSRSMGAPGGGAGTGMSEVEKMLVVLGNSVAALASSVGAKKEAKETVCG